MAPSTKPSLLSRAGLVGGRVTKRKVDFSGGGPVNFPLMGTMFFFYPSSLWKLASLKGFGGNSKLHTLTEKRMWRSDGAIGKAGNGKRDGKQE